MTLTAKQSDNFINSTQFDDDGIGSRSVRMRGCSALFAQLEFRSRHDEMMTKVCCALLGLLFTLPCLDDLLS